MNQGMLVKTAGLGFAVTPNDPSGWHLSLAFQLGFFYPHPLYRYYSMAGLPFPPPPASCLGVTVRHRLCPLSLLSGFTKILLDNTSNHSRLTVLYTQIV